MSTPKSGVSWLESFPPDIWTYFVCYLAGEHIGRLKLTGATSLWKRLKALTVVKFIKLGRGEKACKPLPRFLNELPSLEGLYIHSQGYDWGDKSGLKIDSIPSGVRKLHLRGCGHSRPNVFGEPGTCNLSKLLPHLETLILHSLNILDYSWMSQSPCSLTTLRLVDWNGTVELPPSLIHFEASLVSFSTQFCISKLPCSLESWVSPTLIGVDLMIDLLPQTLRRLSLGARPQYSNRPRSQNLVEQLPKQLTCLQVPFSTEIDFVTNPELIKCLPLTLTELELVPDFPSSAWPLLPPQLKTLVVRCPSFKASQNDAGRGGQGRLTIPFETLPRSITALSLDGLPRYQLFCGPPTPSVRSYFPPQLAFLEIPSFQLSLETAKLLPSSLTYLETGNLCERICEHLPNGLRSLKSSRTLVSPNLIKYLPNALTSLHISQCSEPDDWFDHSTGQDILSVSKQEGYSTHENCGSDSAAWTDSTIQHSTLRYFTLHYAEEFGDSFLLHNQLPNLLQLNFKHSKHVTDISIPLLSRQLTTLKLSSSSSISGKSFQFLPRFLTHLDLRSSESIFDLDIQCLPRTLKDICMRKAIHLTDLCIPDLPPHLEELNLGLNSHIPLSSFPKFPHPIRSQITAYFANWRVLGGRALPQLKILSPSSAVSE